MNQRLFSAVAFVLILLAAIAPGGASDSQSSQPAAAASANQSLQFVSQIGGLTDAVAVQGNYAYIGIGRRLGIVDISAPAAPALVGQTGLLADDVKRR
jgi:hypothetical protein